MDIITMVDLQDTLVYDDSYDSYYIDLIPKGTILKFNEIVPVDPPMVTVPKSTYKYKYKFINADGYIDATITIPNSEVNGEKYALYVNKLENDSIYGAGGRKHKRSRKSRKHKRRRKSRKHKRRSR